jgi:hypothetical protein
MLTKPLMKAVIDLGENPNLMEPLGLPAQSPSGTIY